MQLRNEKGEISLLVQSDLSDTELENDTSTTALKRAADGKTILIPQPSDDPNDPLNWNSWKKNLILICVSLGAFVGDFGLAAGIPAIISHSKEWGISPTVANQPNNVAVVMIGVASLIWMPLTNCFGRAPIFFWCTLMGLMFTLGCLITKDWTTFYAMRALQGATQATGSTIGLPIIHDMFFFHQHAKKIGIWYAFFLVSPFVGPLLGNFMISGLGEWRPVFWLVFAVNGVVLAMTVAFFDETKYNHEVPMDKQPPRQEGVFNRLSRLTGVWQVKHYEGYFERLVPSYRRMLATCFKPIVPIIVLVYSVIFMWSIGINQSSAILLETPQSVGGYGLSSKAIGYIYFTPVIATVLGEAFGHFNNDYLVRRYAKKHNNAFVPEVRLNATYPMAIIMIPGLILVGQTLDKHLHWAGIIFGWGMYQFGVMVVSVAVVAFALDCYPESPGEVSALINFGRALLGFVVGYFQQEWGSKQGYDVSFGLQAVIAAVCFGLLVCIQIWGKNLR